MSKEQKLLNFNMELINFFGKIMPQKAKNSRFELLF